MKTHFGATARALALLSGVVGAVCAPPSAVADRASETPPAAESYKLPISPPRDQGDSDLCWVFATLSMLETNYRVRHPGSRVEFSPGAVQRHAVADRLRRLSVGDSNHLDDGGLAVEALALIRDHGLLAAPDFGDLIDSEPLYAQVEAAADPARLAASLAAALPPTPALTHVDDRPISPEALARSALDGRTWSEYDLAADGRERIGPSSDPDARPETRVHFAPLSKLIALIHASLRRNEAVVWGSTDHALLIFGADYDGDGTPLAYWVKDSHPPYISHMPAGELHQVLNDVTVTDAPAAAASD